MNVAKKQPSKKRPRKSPPRPGPNAKHGDGPGYMATYRVLTKPVNRTNPNHKSPELVRAWESIGNAK